ncbi:MAG: nucleoside-diphosphate kinase [Clostridia bacterium]|nr:nucleoside-diphosphate kinase [Clostridia bacterium]
MEQTYVMIKPDGVKRHLIGEIIKRIENKGYRIVKMEMRKLHKEIVREHYSHLTDKPFYPEIEEYIISGEVVCMIVEGERAVEGVRQLLGSTDGLLASPGTIRGDYATSKTYNLCHASDSTESAEIEIKRFFG